MAGDAYGLTLGFVLASLGFGLFRPGFTSGASLSVSLDEQNAVAGQVTSVNGIAFIAGPAAGVGLYMAGLELPFLATAALMLALGRLDLAQRELRTRGLALRAPRREHPRRDEADAAARRARLLLQTSPRSSHIRSPFPA